MSRLETRKLKRVALLSSAETAPFFLPASISVSVSSVTHFPQITAEISHPHLLSNVRRSRTPSGRFRGGQRVCAGARLARDRTVGRRDLPCRGGGAGGER